MSDSRAGEPADTLNRHVRNDSFQANEQRAANARGDRWIEMCTGDRSEDRDDHDQNGACGDRIAEQGNRLVPAGEAFRHDAGADHCRHQDGGAQSFRRGGVDGRSDAKSRTEEMRRPDVKEEALGRMMTAANLVERVELGVSEKPPVPRVVRPRRRLRRSRQ